MIPYHTAYRILERGRYCFFLMLVCALSACSDFERSIYDPLSPDYIGKNTSDDNTSGGNTPGDDTPRDSIPGNDIPDGFYIQGKAIGAVEAKYTAMSAGSNEVDGAIRTGMYEKYVWLEANKDFSLIENSAGNKKYYGANLEEVNYGYAEGEGLNFADNPDMVILQGQLIIGENAPAMQVKETGLYHIVLDNNAMGDLEYPQIIVHKADWGVRGGMNDWGFTPGEMNRNENGSITYKWVDQNLAKNGEFMFASCHGWKINLDIKGLVKAEVSLGLNDEGNLSNTGNNIKVESAGLYTITLTYTCKSGAIAESFAYTAECTQESSMPETMYIIGNDFGNWEWTSDGVVEMTPVHSHPGHFWAIRHMTTATEFKFCALREWNGDFTGLGNDSGYITTDSYCMVETDDIYMIYVDLENSRVIVEPAAVYGMGDCFGGWDMGVEANKFAVEGTTLVSPAVAADNNIRMYAAAPTAVTGIDWWQMEFNVFDGKIVYRGAGGDQKAVPAIVGQKVTLDFNAGTGRFDEPVIDEPVIDETAVAEVVDLGLSVKWASWNVGATKPEEYGGYYAWGETEVKEIYDGSTYKWYNGDGTYVDIGSDISGTEYDVAHVKWGDGWRMPSLSEFMELRDECTWEWTSVNGVSGQKVTGPNGNSIFLPAAGHRYGTEFTDRSSYGDYWSSTLYDSGNDSACGLGFNRDHWNDWFWDSRRNGRPVRPVKEKVSDTKTVAEVLASGEGTTAKVQATIVSAHTHGFLLHDNTGYIFVNLGEDRGHAVGDVVTVTGEVTKLNGLLSFSASAVVEKAGTAEVVHPKPVVWDGASLDSYLTSPAISYVQYTGVLSTDNGNYYVAVDDAATAIGRVLQPSDGMLSEDHVGQRVMLTGYTVGCSEGRYVVTMLTSVEVVVPPISDMTVAELLASGEGTTAKVQATIVSAHTHGFLLHDNTGYIFVNLGEDRGHAVGDVVTVSGEVTKLNGLLSFSASAVVEKVGTAEVVHPEPVVWDGASLDSYLTSPTISYVQYTGVLSHNNGMYHVMVNGAKTAVGSIESPTENTVNKDYIGGKITVIGYTIGCGDSKYVMTMVVSVEDFPDNDIGVEDYPNGEDWGGGSDDSLDSGIEVDDYDDDENWSGV